ncbi:NADPH-dependent FMN reductase [Myroides sp. LJL110]
MKITGFAATNNTESINLKLVKNVINNFQDHNPLVNILDLNNYEMPIFSPKRNQQGIPDLAKDFLDQIAQSDILVIGLAEYNGSFSTAFKNIFDWSSRVDMNVFQNKPMILVSTSPGPRGASTVLQAAKGTFPFYGADLRASFSLPSFFENFKDGQIINEQLNQELAQVITQFKQSLVNQESTQQAI